MEVSLGVELPFQCKGREGKIFNSYTPKIMGGGERLEDIKGGGGSKGGFGQSRGGVGNPVAPKNIGNGVGKLPYSLARLGNRGE